MTKIKKDILLPKTYNNGEKGTSGRFEHFDGRSKLSYSQITSWLEDAYRGAYIAKYFMGIPDPGNIFSDYGSKVGEWFETGEDASGELSESDLGVLESVGRPEGAIYEREIVVDFGTFVVQGFIDRFQKFPDGVEVIDFKTGSVAKADEYASKNYQQTTLYSHAEVIEGNEIFYSGVKLLHRKGNGSEAHPLRLEGGVKDIPTPYSKERFLDFKKKTVAVAEDISKNFIFYQKFFGEKK